MKAEGLVQRLFDEAKVAWKKEKNALQVKIIKLEEKVVGATLDAKPQPPADPALSPEQKKALEARIQELTDENAALKASSGTAKASKKATKK
jgi:hypothetical protein